MFQCCININTSLGGQKVNCRTATARVFCIFLRDWVGARKESMQLRSRSLRLLSAQANAHDVPNPSQLCLPALTRWKSLKQGFGMNIFSSLWRTIQPSWLSHAFTLTRCEFCAIDALCHLCLFLQAASIAAPATTLAITPTIATLIYLERPWHILAEESIEHCLHCLPDCWTKALKIIKMPWNELNCWGGWSIHINSTDCLLPWSSIWLVVIRSTTRSNCMWFFTMFFIITCAILGCNWLLAASARFLHVSSCPKSVSVSNAEHSALSGNEEVRTIATVPAFKPSYCQLKQS